MKSCASQSYLQWLESRIPDFKSFPTLAVTLPEFGNSLIAKGNIAADTLVLSIPESAFLSMKQVKEQPFFRKYFLDAGVFFRPKQIFAAFLHVEKVKGMESPYYAYLSAIPQSYNNIGLDEEINLFKRKELFDRFKKRQSEAENNYDQLRLYFEELRKKEVCNEEFHSELAALSSFTLAEYKTCLALIESRSLFYRNTSDPKSEVGALVPYYDYCNHSFLTIDIFKHFYFDENKKCYFLKAYKDFSAGEQIFINYGNYNDLHFLELYGFLPWENPNDYIEWNISNSIHSVFFAEEKPEPEKLKLKRISICKRIFQDFNESRWTFQIQKKPGGGWEPSWKDGFFIYIFAVGEKELDSCKSLEEKAYNSEFLSDEHEKRKAEITYNIKAFLINNAYAKMSSEFDKQVPKMHEALSEKISEKIALVEKYSSREMDALRTL